MGLLVDARLGSGGLLPPCTTEVLVCREALHIVNFIGTGYAALAVTTSDGTIIRGKCLHAW